MAALTTQNSASQSKSAKKKKAAKTEAAPPPAPLESPPAAEKAESSNGEGGYESPYIKELYKSIRNVNKKIANASKVDSILAENPNSSLDDLVASRKINADQKAQILKKPQLQASLTQLEEQIAQYQKFDQEYKTRSQNEKTSFEKSFSEKASKELEEAVANARAEAAAEAKKDQQSSMLLLSQFLRLAAARRSEESDSTLDENMALEGVLLSVYSGDETAVAAMTKLITGSDDKTSAVTGEPLSTTYAQVKAASLAHAPTPFIEQPSDKIPEDTQTEAAEQPILSDPTILHAGLTELDAPPAVAITNGHGNEDSAAQIGSGIPQNAGIDDGAANAAAEANWDPTAEMSGSQEWVDVTIPRDIGETESGYTATPAAPTNTQSWADEQPDSPKAEIPNPANDGFHEVHRNRGGNRDSQNRGGRGGRGGRGDGHRGRGSFRGGDNGYRGRGRGGPRGGAQNTPREA